MSREHNLLADLGHALGLICVLAVGIICGCAKNPVIHLLGPSLSNDNYPVWSADGNSVAYLAQVIERDSAHVSMREFIEIVDVRTGVRQTGIEIFPGWISSLAWSPDGEWIAFSATDGVYKISRDGDSLLQLYSAVYANFVSWSRTSDRIFFETETYPEAGLYAVSPDGSNPSQLLSWYRQYVSSPTCFRDCDTLVAYTSSCLVLMQPGDSALAGTVGCGSLGSWPARPSPDHRWVAIRPWDSHKREAHLVLYSRATGSQTKLINTSVGSFDFSPDGSEIVFADFETTRGLQIINISTREVRQLTPGYRQ